MANGRERILARFSGHDKELLWLPDLTLWYSWHERRGTLPAKWIDRTLPEIARDLGAPVWATARPWRLEPGEVQVQSVETADERTTAYHTRAGTITARWSLGPDGDWWQTDYPIKSAADLPAARIVLEERSYAVDYDAWERLAEQVGDDGVAAVELPRRPYTDLTHSFLGWGDGLMLLLGDERDAIVSLLELQEAKLQELVSRLAALPARVYYSPDNLDGQFISPPAFREHLSSSYATTVQVLAPGGKHMVVHAGGPVRRLLPLLAEAGVAGVEGVAASPQGDTDLREARGLAGPSLVLWGGLPQDLLLATTAEEEFEGGVREAAQMALEDGRSIIGVADRVPVEADVTRLRRMPRLLGV